MIYVHIYFRRDLANRRMQLEHKKKAYAHEANKRVSGRHYGDPRIRVTEWPWHYDKPALNNLQSQ